MMSITHAAITTAGVSLLLSTSHPLPLALAVLVSQLPDLDTTTGLIGQVLYPVSSWIEDRFPHRSVTHRLVATVGLAAVALPIGIYLGYWKVASAVPLGHALSCFSDCFTRQGVQLQAGGRQYETVMLAGDTLTLELHPLEVGVLQLSEQWMAGSLVLTFREEIDIEYSRIVEVKTNTSCS